MLLLQTNKPAHHLFQRLLLALRLARQLGAPMPKAGDVLLHSRMRVRGDLFPAPLCRCHSIAMQAQPLCSFNPQTLLTLSSTAVKGLQK